MESRIGFGEWLPDLPPLANPGLVTALNTLPISGGYSGMGSRQVITGATGLATRPRGGISGITPSGNPFNFVGLEDSLHLLSHAEYDVTRATGGAYNCSGTARWEFARFGRYVVAVNGNDDTQVFDIEKMMTDDFPFERLGNATTRAPRAKHIGVLGRFIILGNTYDRVNGTDETAIHWPALNDIFNWPDPTTEEAEALQSSRQELAADAGAVQAVVSGAELGAIFQEKSIWRADYRGGSEIFELNRVEPNRGLLIPQFAIPFGRNVFYYSQDGFYLFDFTTSQPIGRDRVDKYFKNDMKSEYLHRFSAAPDPATQRIYMSYTGADSEYQVDPGAPNKLLIYDWGLDKFTHGDEAMELVQQVVHFGLSIDAPHTTDDPNVGGIDGAGLLSFDERQAAVDARQIGGYGPATSGNDFELSDFGGAQLPATIETGRREVIPGSRSLVDTARPLVEAVDPTVQAAALSRTNQDVEFGPEAAIDEDGDAPLRVDARYHAFRVNLPVGFEHAMGLDVVAFRSGGR